MAAIGSAANNTDPSTARDKLDFFIDNDPPKEHFLDDVLTGLSKAQKEIPPKYFYDEPGSDLFAKICQTEEYYVTRTEIALLEAISQDLADRIGPNAKIIEFGSGASRKVRILLNSLPAPSHYVAIDISKDYLIEAASAIAEDYPRLTVGAVAADFLKPIPMPPQIATDGGALLGFFPGSTIGNFSTDEAITLLKTAHDLLAPDGALLIGVDVKKDPEILEAAYNDKDGITAAFNLNLLTRINRELDADFNVHAFRHEAIYNAAQSRIEMHLRATTPQTVTIGQHQFTFTEGETIHTENSRKYAVEEFTALAAQAGFAADEMWTDDHGLFGLHLLRAR